MTGRIITVGEIMLRLKPPGYERLLQSPLLETTFGGGESNTAVSLAQLGLDVAFVTALPANPIGDACIRFLRGYGVDSSLIQRSGERIGVYFLEAGASQRPAQVIYDRGRSAMATAKADSFDWDAIFTGSSWLHITGITPAISQTAADLAITAVQAAHAHGLTISCDTSHRSKLWQYGKTPLQIMPQLAHFVHILFANREDCELSYGVQLAAAEKAKADPTERNALVAQKMFAKFPHLHTQIFTHREGFSASHNAWGATMVINGRSQVSSPRYDITHIVDRVGGGDAFAAGIIYGFMTEMPPQEIIDFAAAAACLKHSIPGDVNLVTVAEIMQLMHGDSAGRIQR